MKKPQYVKIKEYLLKQIENENYKPNEKIPSENELSKMFNVTRMTVRQAITELQNDNYVYSVPKIGIFVSRKSKFKSFDGLNSFSEDSKRVKGVNINQIIYNDLEKVLPEIAKEMVIEPDSDVWHLTRVRSIDGETVAYEDDYINFTLSGSITKKIAERSLFQYFENFLDLHIAYSDQEITAVLATKEIAQYLGITEGSPLLKVTSNTILHDGSCIEYGHTYYRVDKYKFNQVAYRRK